MVCEQLLLLTGLFFSPQPAPDAGVVPPAAVVPPGDNNPVLRLESGGPQSYVTGLAFSPDGQRLYSTGWDKSVQVWKLDQGKFQASPLDSLRIPTGGGPYGAINAMAISEDGKWLAVGGQGYMRGRAGERNAGWVIPAGVLGIQEQLDEGLIYVFNTETRQASLLQGHRGPVMSLAFAVGRPTSPPELVSVAQERTNGETDVRPIIRCWNVAQAKVISSLDTFPGMQHLPDLKYRPGLSAWSAGPAAGQVRVAIAWGEDRLRLWDVENGGVVEAQPNQLTFDLSTVVALSPAGNKLFTGAQSQAGVWTIGTTPQFQSAVIPSMPYNQPPPNLVSAAALIPANGNTGARIAMVVSRFQSQFPDKFVHNGLVRFRLIVIEAAPPFTVVRELDLNWQAQERQPSLAVSKDGTWLAVAGNQLNDIAVFKIADLAKAEPVPQRLRSFGTIVTDATFVTNAKGDWGLKMVGAGDVPKSLILDIRQRRIQSGDDTWNDYSIPDEWTIGKRDSEKLTLTHKEQAPIEVSLPKGYVPIRVAVCPKSAHCSVPLVAVSAQDRGQPLLQIFRADKGELLRWCVGHTEAIRALHFSKDGRFLISTGSDRTISVWSVTDLDRRTIGKRGRIDGLVVESLNNRLMVIKAPQGLGLLKDDEIVNVSGAVDPNQEVQPGKPVVLQGAKNFYQTLLNELPGKDVEVTIRRAGKLQVVKCTIQQAVDESKPLFTVFVAPGAENEWEWIGWHPLGLFSTRSDRLDRWLGWHFNTGDPENPARFAAIGEYRNKFYEKDLLQKLIADEAFKPVPVVEDPKISAGIRYQKNWVNTDYADRPQVRFKESELVAEITGISPDRIMSVDATFDAGAGVPLERGPDREWSASLAQIPWARGLHSITIRVKTPDREVSERLDVNFFPSPPAIDWKPNWKRPIEEKQVVVKAIVTPAEEQMIVALYQDVNGKENLIKQWGPAKNVVEVNQAVNIAPGETRLVLKAWNADPGADLDMERAMVSAPVLRTSPAPTFEIASVTSTSVKGNGEILELDLAADDRGIYLTNTPKLRVRGQISATSPLVVAEIKLPEAQALKFSAGAMMVAFDQSLTLKPGRQTVVIRAVDDGNIANERKLEFLYRPPLPKIVAISAESAVIKPLPAGVAKNPRVIYGGFNAGNVTVTATLEGEFDPACQLQYEILKKSKDAVGTIDFKKTVKPGQENLAASAQLELGKNTFSLVVRDQWNQVDSRTVEVEYKSPPEILSVTVPQGIVQSPIDLKCQVRSPIPLRTATVRIGDRMEHPSGFAKSVEPDIWSFELKNIGLEKGPHDLVVTVTNDDGASLESKTARVEIAPPPVLPPKLTLLNQMTSTNTDPIKVEFSVVSKVPVEILIDVASKDKKLEQIKVLAANVPIDGSKTETLVALAEGMNTINVTAKNSGGSTTQSFGISYVPPPVIVDVVSVGDNPVRPQPQNGIRVLNGPLLQAAPILAGRVTVPKGQLASDFTVKVWANGFMMKPEKVTINPQSPHIGTYKSQLILGQMANKIEVQVYRNGSEVATIERLKMEVACNAPQNTQELYVLLLGNGQDKNVLLERAHNSLLKGALGAKQEQNLEKGVGRWSSNAFGNIYVYDGIREKYSRTIGQLTDMTRKMQGAQNQGALPIAMVYYQGEITLSDNDFALDKMAPEDVDPQKHVTGSLLEQHLVQKCGAHVVFLDLQNAENLTDRDIWPKSPNLGIAVANWKGDGEQPEGTRLSSILKETLPGIRTIGELRPKLRAATMNGQVEIVDLLDDLRELRVGALD